MGCGSHNGDPHRTKARAGPAKIYVPEHCLFPGVSHDAQIAPWHRSLGGLTDFIRAVLAAGIWTESQFAVLVHGVPTLFDGAHVGFAFVDLMRNAEIHCN